MLRTVLSVYRSAFAGLPREVWLLSLVALVNRSGTMVLPFISLYLNVERGFSITTAGKVLGLYGVGAIFGSYCGGWLADRLGATRTQQLSLATSGLGYLALGAARDLGSISIWVFVVSVLSESFRPAVMADMAHRAPPAVQVRSFALLRLAVNVAMGVGPAVGGFLALRSYAWLFRVEAATCWAAALLLFLLLGTSRSESESRVREAPDAAGRSPLRDGPFLGLMLLVTLMAILFFQIFSTLPVYLNRVYGFPESVIGTLLALNAGLIVAFEMVLIHWAERRNRMLLIGLGTFLVGAGLGLLPLGRSMAFAGLTVVIWTLGEMLAMPLMNAVVADRSSAGTHGRYMGTYTMAYSVAFVIGPAGGMYVYDHLGPDVLWFGAGLSGVAMWILACALIGPFRRDSAKARPGSPAAPHDPDRDC